MQKYILLILFCGILWVSWDRNIFFARLFFFLSNEVLLYMEL